jgi:hypothetical protein
VEVSSVCRNFIEQASARRWPDAVTTLNGLNMYEMLRALKALDAADLLSFCGALTALRSAVNAPRIEYALTVVETNKLPTTVPSGLPADQVTDARHFVVRPRSILQEPIPRAKISGYNVGLTAVTNALMQQHLGAPRSSYSSQCQPIDNPSLRRRITTANVGPFSVTGLDSATVSLTSVMTAIRSNQRLVYRVLGTEGMLCARYVRGSTTNISNHSWGTAIDLQVNRVTDARGDNMVMFGMHLISAIFNAEGWYWGAGFPTEDGMHFEAGRALVIGWASAP